MPRKVVSPERMAWLSMRKRCLSVGREGYAYWGGRGICICGRCKEWPGFIATVGPRPSSKHSLDRIKNELGYWCGVCEECLANGWPMNMRWATIAEQNANRRCVVLVTIGDRTAALDVWCVERKITHRSAWYWFERTGDWQVALDAAVANKRGDLQTILVGGIAKTYLQLEEETGLSRYTIKHRILKQGMTPEEAVSPVRRKPGPRPKSPE